MLPVNRDSASSVYLQVRVDLLNDPLFAPLQQRCSAATARQAIGKTRRQLETLIERRLIRIDVGVRVQWVPFVFV